MISKFVSGQCRIHKIDRGTYKDDSHNSKHSDSLPLSLRLLRNLERFLCLDACGSSIHDVALLLLKVDEEVELQEIRLINSWTRIYLLNRGSPPPCKPWKPDRSSGKCRRCCCGPLSAGGWRVMV